MQLATWLKLKNLSISEFAKQIGRHHSLVHKYIYEDVIPKPNIMKALFLTTYGAVTANDFYHLSDKIFNEALASRKKTIGEPEMDFRY